MGDVAGGGAAPGTGRDGDVPGAKGRGLSARVGPHAAAFASDVEVAVIGKNASSANEGAAITALGVGVHVVHLMRESKVE